MPRRKDDFSEGDKIKALLWCARHCCLCGKAAGVSIEVAHLKLGDSSFDNAIPLCFDCHGATGHYSRDHPRGVKYRVRELKPRREQIYELHTRHLVPPVEYRLDQQVGDQAPRPLPDVGFVISNIGGIYPIQARVRVTLVQGSRRLQVASAHYGGGSLWNLNPGFRVHGHFQLPDTFDAKGKPLRARVDVTLIDIYARGHVLLPVGFVHTLGGPSNWYLEPSMEVLDVAASRAAGRGWRASSRGSS